MTAWTGRWAAIIGIGVGLAFAPNVFIPGAVAQETPPGWSPPLPESVPNLREEWRDVITELSTYAKGRNPKFIMVMRGGVELLVRGKREAQWDQIMDPIGQNYDKRLPLGAAFRPFMKLIDGEIFDGLYCGEMAYDGPLDKAVQARLADDAIVARELAQGIERPAPGVENGPYSPDPKAEAARVDQIRHKADMEDHKRRVLRAFGALRDAGRPIFSIDNCPTQAAVDAAHRAADRDHVVSFADQGNAKLDRIPPGHPFHENASAIGTLAQVRTLLPNPKGDRFGSKEEWLAALSATSYDAMVIDVSWRGIDLITKADVARLKYKNLGGPRLVLAEMPMGRAFDGRWYWQTGWQAGRPAFLFAVDPHEAGAYVIDAQDPAWKEILGKTIAGIIDLGFDGVVMDDLDWYLWFEDIMPLDR
jgi:hypothetical protein